MSSRASRSRASCARAAGDVRVARHARRHGSALVPAQAIAIDVDRVQRACAARACCRAAAAAANLLVAFWQSARASSRSAPDVVLGLGGFVAFPGGMMASLLQPAARDPRAERRRGPRQPLLAQLARPACWSAFPQALASIGANGPAIRCARRSPRMPPPAQRFRGPQRAAAAPGRRRQPGRAGAERSGAAGARAAADERPHGRAPGGREAPATRSRRYARCGRRGGAASPSSTTWRARYADADLVICRAGALTDRRARRGRRGERPGAVSARRRRSPDAQRALPGERAPRSWCRSAS